MRCLFVMFFFFSAVAILAKFYSYLTGLNNGMANEGEFLWYNTAGVVVAPRVLRLAVDYTESVLTARCTEALSAVLNPRRSLSLLVAFYCSHLTPSVFDFDIEVFFFYIKSTSVFLFFF